MDFPIIMLDSALRIHRFNPAAQRILNLVPGDVGRSKVRDRNGWQYLLRMRPYKTSENRIEGAVMVLVDIDQLAK